MAFSVFEAIGALGASVTILRYLEYYEHFYTLILTLKQASPSSIMLLLPIGSFSMLNI